MHAITIPRFKTGWHGRIRTCDQRINSPSLYQLSYMPRNRDRLSDLSRLDWYGVRSLLDMAHWLGLDFSSSRHSDVF